MTERTRSAALCTIWMTWAAVVVAHYFTLPGNRFLFFEGAIGVPHGWREAVIRGALAVGAAAAMTLAAWIVGRQSSKWFFNDLFTGPLEAFVFHVAIGFTFLSFAFLGLASVGRYRPLIVGGIVLLLAAAGCVSAPRSLLRAVRSLSLPRPTDLAFVLCASAAVACASIAALAPETEYDALWYHLFLPARWLAAGRPVDLIEEYISLYPLGWEMLYGGAMALGGPIAAKAFHFLCLPLAAVTTSLLTSLLFPRANPWVAVALLVTAPTILWESTTAYVDLAVAWYLALVVYALFRHNISRDRRWLILGATLMGMTLGIKHLGLVALAITATILAFGEARTATRGHAVRSVVVFASIALAMASPWYVRAYRASRNPVFPEMYSVFGATPPTRWSADAERSLRRFKDHFGRSRTAAHLATLPWDVTVHGSSYGGTFGPLFLILIPLAASWRRPNGAPAGWLLLVGCAAYIAVWASPISSFQLRFLVPVVPFLAVLGARGAMRIGEAAEATLKHGGVAAGAVIVVLLLMNLPPAIEWHERDRVAWSGWLTHVIRGLPAGVVFGVEKQDDYLARVVPSYRAWRFIDTMLPQSSRILSFSGGDNLYSHRSRVSSEAILAHAATWGTAAGEERVAARALTELGITHVLFDKRQFENGSVQSIAIGTTEMQRCCLTLRYEDHRFAVYEVRPGVW